MTWTTGAWTEVTLDGIVYKVRPAALLGNNPRLRIRSTGVTFHYDGCAWQRYYGGWWDTIPLAWTDEEIRLYATSVQE